MTKHRAHYISTSDSNGYPYCVNCGKSPDLHTDTRRALVCPCEHHNVSRPTASHPFYFCNDCKKDVYD